MFWGSISQDEVLKFKEPDMGSNLFTSQGEAETFEFPTDCMALYWGRVYDDWVSQPFLPILMLVFFQLPNM